MSPSPSLQGKVCTRSIRGILLFQIISFCNHQPTNHDLLQPESDSIIIIGCCYQLSSSQISKLYFNSTKNPRSGCSLSTFSAGDRSRSLQRGGEVRTSRTSRSSRSVSTERIILRGQLSNSTPQDLDQGGGGGGCRSWRSNEGLITPVSCGGCSPYQTPGDSPAPASPAIVTKFQPHFLTRVPGMSRTTRRPLAPSDSVSSLTSQRCHSIPRSTTTDVLYRSDIITGITLSYISYIPVATLCLPSLNVLQTLDISNLNLIIDTGCPKKMGLVFRGQFRPLNGRKSKKARKQNSNLSTRRGFQVSL